MTMTTGAATTLLGNIAGARPMGHDGVAADALIAVPLALFQSLLAQLPAAQAAHAQSPLGSPTAQLNTAQQPGAWYAPGSPYGPAFGSPYGSPYGQHSWYGGLPGIGAGQVMPFQVIPGGVGYR